MTTAKQPPYKERKRRLTKPIMLVPQSERYNFNKQEAAQEQEEGQEAQAKQAPSRSGDLINIDASKEQALEYVGRPSPVSGPRGQA